MQRLLALLLTVAMLAGLGVTALAADTDAAEETAIVLSDEGITVDGEAVSEDAEDAVYIGAEIIYYHDLDTYESGNLYGEGTADERHTEEEAAAHTCLTITAAGTYRISGTLSAGQIVVDLGEDAVTDPEAVVTLILDNASVTCTVAPALIVYNVYECDTAWTAYDNDEADSYEASATQDTSAAGINIILADGSVNTFTGSHVARIYKDNEEQKKKYKYDGAFYSVQSMNIDGEEAGDGVLNIIADNEGLDSELHLTINGGVINIQSQDDGINTNEDNVSVTTINGGSLHIVAGLGSEGDGIDSNGYLVINGGVVIALAKPDSDSGLDSDMGSYINGGYVVATGSTMDWAESDSAQVTLNLQFASAQAADEAIIITDLEGNVVFAYDPEKDESTGSNYRGYQGAVISCPELQVGSSYYIYVGGDVYGEETDGLYDVSTVTGFSDEAVQQQYTGTDVGMGGPGFGGMGGPGFGGGFDGGLNDLFPALTEDDELEAFLQENGEALLAIVQENADTLQAMLEAFTGSWDDFQAEYGEQLEALFGDYADTLADLLEDYADELQAALESIPAFDGAAPENHDDEVMPVQEGEAPAGGEAPEAPADGGAPADGEAPAGGETPAMGEGPTEGDFGGGQPGQGGQDAAASVTFYMTDMVNAFSGVSDYDPDAVVTTGFADVPANAWYAGSVSDVVSAGLMTGVTENSFAPSADLTWGDLAEALYLLSGSPADYADATAWAESAAWWNGDAAASITREELAVVLYAWVGGEALEADLSSFPDSGDISADALEAVQWAVASGILEGDDQGTLQPGAAVTRAQAAAIFARIS